MPLYEYRCREGHTFEKIQKFSDQPLDRCEVCGSPAERLISSPAIQFKGTGWYITDYARKSSAESSNGKGEKKEKTETSKPGEKGGGEKSSGDTTPSSSSSKSESKST